MAEETTTVPAAAVKDRTHTDGSSLKAPPKTEEAKDEAKSAEAVATPAAAEPTPADKPKSEDERKASRIAKLAREESAIRAERDRVKVERSQLETERKALDGYKAKAEQLDRFFATVQTMRQATPDGRKARAAFFQETGLTFEQFAKDVAEPDSVDPVAVARAEVERVNKERDEAKAKADAEAKAKADAAETAKQIAGLKANIKKAAVDGGKKFALVNKYDATESAYQVMVAQYNLDKTILPLDTALQKVEDDLRRQVREDPELAETLRELVGPPPKKTAAKPEASIREERKPEARDEPKPARPTSSFNSKAHVDELLARAKARKKLEQSA